EHRTRGRPSHRLRISPQDRESVATMGGTGTGGGGDRWHPFPLSGPPVSAAWAVALCHRSRGGAGEGATLTRGATGVGPLSDATGCLVGRSGTTVGVGLADGIATPGRSAGATPGGHSARA